MKRHSEFLAVGIALTAVLCLSACGKAVPGPKAILSTASVSDSPRNPETSQTQSNTFSIPDDFPTDIPILEGELVLSSVAGSVPSKTWAIEVLVDDLNAARVQSLDALGTAGFAVNSESGMGTDNYDALLSRFDYSVMLKIYLEPETGEREIRYVVTPSNN